MPRKEPQKTGRVLMLPLDSIEPSPYQARTAFDEQEIAALAVSILQNGLLQPVSVRRTGLHKYQLVAGERRLRACRLAKLEKIPAILADYDDSESAALGLLENLQRSQLDPFDTARGIKEVIRLWGCTQAEAARRLGLSQPALANKLRLLTLTPAQQQLCAAHHLSERHARAVLRLPENRRTAALEKIARDKLSVRQADKLVDGMLAAPKGPSPCRRTIPMVRDVRFFVNTLQHAVDLMTQKGIAATTTCGKRDGCLEYTVRIPVGEGHPAPVVAPRAGAAQAPAQYGSQAEKPAPPERQAETGARHTLPAWQGGCPAAGPAPEAPPPPPAREDAASRPRAAAETPDAAPAQSPDNARPAAVQAAQAVRAAAVQAPPPAEALQQAPLTAAELEALLAPAEAPPQTGDFAVQLL